jgi:hypothetical protein
MDWQYGIKVGIDPAVIEVIKNGYNPTVLPHDKTEFTNNLSSRQFPIITTQEINKLLEQDRIEEVWKEEDIHDINPLTLVVKPNKNRLCIDTSRILNKTIPTQKFKMRGLEHRLLNFTKGNWMAKIDLKNGYLHIPLHKDFRKFTCFRWQGRIYRYKWLPFGINDAPRIFQKIANEVCISLLKDGHYVETYLDDFWIEGRTYEECKRTLQATLERLKKFGFTCNYKKSQLSPTQKMEYIGFEFDSNAGLAKLREETILKIRKEIKKARSAPTARNMRKMMGTIAYATTIDQRLKPFTMKTYKQIGNKQKEEIINWTPRAMAQIQTLERLLPQAEYKARNAFKEKCIITSDASRHGFAFWDNITNKDSWIEWNTSKHSTWTELSAAIRAIKSRSVKTHLNLLRTDNTSTMAILNSGSSKNETLNELTMDLANWAFKHKIHYSADYIEGRLNTRADAHSRRNHDKIKTPPGETLLVSQLLIPSPPTIIRHSTEIRSTDKSEISENQTTRPTGTGMDPLGRPIGKLKNLTPPPLLGKIPIPLQDEGSPSQEVWEKKTPIPENSQKTHKKKIRGTPKIELPPELPTKISRALLSLPTDVVINRQFTYKQIPITTRALAKLSNKEAKKMQVILQRDTKSQYSFGNFQTTNGKFIFYDKRLFPETNANIIKRVFELANKSPREDKCLITFLGNECWISLEKKNRNYETFAHIIWNNDEDYKGLVNTFIFQTDGKSKCVSETAHDEIEDPIFSYWLDKMSVAIEARNFQEESMENYNEDSD